MCEKRGYMLSETKNVVFQLKAPYNTPKTTVINSYTLQEIFPVPDFTHQLSLTLQKPNHKKILQKYIGSIGPIYRITLEFGGLAIKMKRSLLFLKWNLVTGLQFHHSCWHIDSLCFCDKTCSLDKKTLRYSKNRTLRIFRTRVDSRFETALQVLQIIKKNLLKKTLVKTFF